MEIIQYLQSTTIKITLTLYKTLQLPINFRKNTKEQKNLNKIQFHDFIHTYIILRL